MELSIIIVNYNVKYFLEQTISSVLKACKNISSEIIVVDNNSKDESVELIKSKFPSVILIENKSNPGFSKANNQALVIAKGAFVLLLNPDTVVAEDCFENCMNKMHEDTSIGALGVRMIDGRGDFLPESKRSLPLPKVAFYKIVGLSNLFPTSSEFSKYHLGNIPQHQSTYIEILSGAFMFMRKSVLDKIGYLDETFFMYGEDIDLSYRFILAGYKNYYLADTTIIHYKGESTKKGSINYVKAFYEAMIIFAKKHFEKSKANTFTMLMEFAIWAKAGISIIQNLFEKFNLIIIDFLCSILAIEFIKSQWALNIKHQPTYYPPIFTYIIVPVYIIIWLGTIYFNGGYDKPIKAYKIIRGTFWGTIFIAAFYAFLPEDYRYSRAIILFGAFAIGILMLIIRTIRNFMLFNKFQVDESEQNKVIIVGTNEESRRVIEVLEKTGINIDYIGRIGEHEDDVLLGNYSDLRNIVEIFKPEEIIFCTKDVAIKKVILWMTELGNMIHYKILPEGGESLIGSNSKNTSGDLYARDINLKLGQAHSQRNKRVFDLFTALFLLIISPFMIIKNKNKCSITNLLLVIFGTLSFVGFFKNNEQNYLPHIKPGLLFPIINQNKIVNAATELQLNLRYAKNYSISEDIRIVYSYLFR